MRSALPSNPVSKLAYSMLLTFLGFQQFFPAFLIEHVEICTKTFVFSVVPRTSKSAQQNKRVFTSLTARLETKLCLSPTLVIRLRETVVAVKQKL